MFRSIASIIAPIVIWGGLFVGTAAVAAAISPDSFTEEGTTTQPGILIMFIAVSVVLSVLAGWLCGKIAPRRIMTHVLILGVIQLLIGIGVQASVWELMPVWYHLVLLVLVVPMHLLGGRLAGSDSVSGRAGSKALSPA